MKMVRVQLGEEGQPVRIFRDKSWRLLPEDEVAWISKEEAVTEIRRQVFEKTKDDNGYYHCHDCGKPTNWLSGEMHEVVPKGKGGEVSVDNSICLCNNCHTGAKNSRHGDRRWQTSKLT